MKWDTFAVIAGGAAGALIGLLFVAVSLRIEQITAAPELRSRAAQTLGLFLTVLFSSLLLVLPDQSTTALGIELVVLAAVMGSVLSVLDRRARRAARGQRLAQLLDSISPNALTALLVAAAGITMITASGSPAGYRILVAPTFAALAGGVINAWLLLTTVPTTP